jgi:hypothetical protein
MNRKDKIRIVKHLLTVIEEMQVRIIVVFLFALIIVITFCLATLLYNYLLS